MDKHLTYLLVGVTLIACVIIGAVVLTTSPTSNTTNTGPSPVIHIVAAENVWGSLAAELVGTHGEAISIVSDPNADPHEYASTTKDAQEIATASLVIENGAGYDSWADKLIAASDNPARRDMDVSDLLGKKAGDNPHFWYDPTAVNKVVVKIADDLQSIDPANAAYYKSQLALVQASLAGYQSCITTIKKQFAGTKVAATEDIVVYLAQAASLNLISPTAFTSAVAEGNDPTAQSIVQFEDQLKNKEPAVLVYNQQTVTPLTSSMKQTATDNGIPIVAVTETIQPPTASFEDWMNGQVTQLQNALSAKRTK